VGGASLLLCAHFTRAHGKLLRSLATVDRNSLVWGFLAGGVMVAATYVLYPVASHFIPRLPLGTAHLYERLNSSSLPVRLILLPFVIVGEEVVWRGVVQSCFARRGHALLAAVCAALFYAAAHAPMQEPLLTLLAGCCGLYWGLLRWRTGSLVPPLLAHLAWDLVVMVLVPLAH
jgi:membrane protease YdiL (CAAX protease family)